MLFFSDNDVYGADIYHVMKFGSKATAWASPTLICPQLRRAGPTVAALEKSVEQYAESRKREMLEKDATKTEAEVDALQEQWTTEMMAKLRNRKIKKVISPEAMTRFENMRRSGILDIEGEEDVRNAVVGMVHRQEVSSPSGDC